MADPIKPSFKSVNFLLTEQEFKLIKVYTAYRGITIRDLVSGMMRAWLAENDQEIRATVNSNSLSE